MNYIIDTNLKNLYVCSDHFVTGKPSGEFHKKHVDWAPSINVGSNKTKQFLDGDHRVRNNVAFDKADTPPLIDVETATEVEDSGFLNNLIQGDLVMADRGFTVHEAVTLRNANLAVPSFLGKQTQLSNVEVEYFRGLARIRIHVERVIGATKQRFTILEGPLHRATLSVSKGEDSAIIDKIVMVCCALYNSCSSVVPLL